MHDAAQKSATLVLYTWNQHGFKQHACYSAMWREATEKLKLYDPYREKSDLSTEREVFNEMLHPFQGKICLLDATIMTAQFESQEALTQFVLAWS